MMKHYVNDKTWFLMTTPLVNKESFFKKKNLCCLQQAFVSMNYKKKVPSTSNFLKHIFLLYVLTTPSILFSILPKLSYLSYEKKKIKIILIVS